MPMELVTTLASLDAGKAMPVHEVLDISFVAPKEGWVGGEGGRAGENLDMSMPKGPTPPDIVPPIA
jgi:hypothetical protein